MATRKTNTAKAAKTAKPVESAEDEAAMPGEQAEIVESTAEGKPAEAIIAKVIHRFRDKDTLSSLQPGMVIAVSPERFEEICAAGDFLERVQ